MISQRSLTLFNFGKSVFISANSVKPLINLKRSVLEYDTLGTIGKFRGHENPV